MDQHYITRGYLSGFCDPETPERQMPWIWIGHLQEGRVTRRAPKNVATRPNYYSVERDGRAEHAAEQLLSTIESNGVPILRKIRSGQFALSDEERAHLALFMGFMVTRTPGFRGFMERAAGKHAESVMRVMAQHPEYFRRTARAAAEAAGHSVTDEQIERARLSGLAPERHYIVRGTVEFSLAQALKLAETPGREMLAMRWHFAVTPAHEPFITSDAPVTWRHPSGVAGLRRRRTEMSFPISPQICLNGTHTEPEGVQDATPERVRDLNRERVRFADTQAFANTEAAGEQAVKTYGVLRDAGQAHASPFRLFVVEEGDLSDVSAQITADRNAGR
jgi:hypothetical protein